MTGSQAKACQSAVGIVSSMSILILAYLMIPTPVRLVSDAETPVPTVEAPLRAG